MPDDALLGTAVNCHQRMIKYSGDLVDYGLTEEIINEFEILCDTFKLAISEAIDAKEERDIEARNRVKASNELYEMVSTYCEFGKKYYFNNNSAKYNDYVIYTPSSGGLDAPTNLVFGRSNKSIQWYEVDNATSYELEKSYDNVNFSEVYSGADPFYFFDEFEPLVYYRVRARNSKGFGPFSETLVCEYIDPLPIPQDVSAVLTGETAVQVSISWSAVRTADQYHVYKCVTNIGSPSGTYVFTQNTQILNVVLNAMSGKRTYYKVKALCYTQQSDFSEEVFVDVVV